MKTPKRAFGDWGEGLASSFLKKRGYKIIEKNYRMKRGELDIVAWRRMPAFGRTLCFIEVKTRRGERGSAERATTPEKQRRMRRAALSWCLKNDVPTDRTPIQFEQVSVYDTGAGPEIFHYILPVE